MAESPLEKLLRLATVDVAGFQRVERGRVQHVRPHVENLAEALRNRSEESVKAHDTASATTKSEFAKDEAEFKARSASAWKQGEQDWKSKDWARGAAEIGKQSAKPSRAPAQRGGVRQGASNRTHTSGSARAQARSQRMANRGRSLGSPVTSSSAPSGTLQDRVEQMEQGRQDVAGRVSNHPLFSPPAPAGSPADQLIHDAATNAVQEAAIRSGAIDQTGMSHVMHEMATMQAQLSVAQMHTKDETQAVEERVTKDRKEEARANMVLNILGILAGILLVATTGGVGALIGEVMAFGWTVEIGRELAQYNGVESGKHPALRRALAHPALQAQAGALKAKRVVTRKGLALPTGAPKSAPKPAVKEPQTPQTPTPLKPK